MVTIEGKLTDGEITVINRINDTEVFSIMVREVIAQEDYFGEKAFVKSAAVAFLKGTEEQLQGYLDKFKLEHGSTIKGHIRVQRSNQPFHAKDKQVQIGTTGKGYFMNGHPVYRSAEFVGNSEGSSLPTWVPQTQFGISIGMAEPVVTLAVVAAAEPQVLVALVPNPAFEAAGPGL